MKMIGRMAVKMAMRKGCGEHGWIAGRQAGRIPLGGCWKAVAGLLDFAGKIIAQRVYFESPFFFIYYLQFFHSLSTFTIFVPTSSASTWREWEHCVVSQWLNYSCTLLKGRK